MISNGVHNTYDHRSRRIRKEVSRRGAGTHRGEAERTHAYLWDGCNVLRETVAIGSGSTQSAVTNYMWGLDLSGGMRGAEEAGLLRRAAGLLQSHRNRESVRGGAECPLVRYGLLAVQRMSVSLSDGRTRGRFLPR